MSQLYLALFLITAAVNAAAQLLLKRGSQDVALILAGQENFIVRIFKVFINPFVLGAALLLAFGMVVWLKLISRMEFSRAYPVNIALTILITSILSVYLFNEAVTLPKVAGVGLIIVGLWFLLANA